MFVCPHCQFKNPHQNRFCQQCGEPLQLWRAILSPISSTDNIAQFSLDASYLDTQQQRYQLPIPLPALPSGTEVEFLVLDCQPEMPSALDTIDATETSEQLLEEDTLVDVPKLAYPYLLLQAHFFPAIPDLHTAWQTDTHAVLLIEDRSQWQKLTELWGQESVAPLERVHWLYEMAELWDALKDWDAQSSLLEQDNLRVDDDQILCLRRLYSTPATQHTLQDLGLFWHRLLRQGGQAAVPALVNLALAVSNGDITTATDIKAQLADIAEDLPTDDDEVTTPDALPRSAAREPMPMSAAEEREGLMSQEWDELTDELTLDELDQASEADETAEGSDYPTMVLPMKLVSLDHIGQTHVGCQRDHNEDFFCALTELCKVDSPEDATLSARGLYVLCDGMGGHAGGEVASALAVKTLQTYFREHWDDLPSQASLQEAIEQANQAIFELNQAESRSGSGRMGTTLVMVMLQDTQAVVAHVGDSRLYGYTRRLGLKQITLDHEVGQREIQRGVEPAIAYTRPDAYQLTQALGPRDHHSIVPSIQYFDIAEDTLFLLCSDGLSDNDLPERYCETHVAPLLRSHTDLDEGVAQLIDLANEHNGHDNITVVAIRLKLRPNLEEMPNR
ncbi:Protein serin-threonin phosphatase [Halomicronema hongdechloris C2206]|uniref:Protein serin-threonin phosphatase n=1 Tax=Halomicronema hongdechloris C2206 TaxID=1641165 RepID=A0A1Z3HQ13_9CYAN|nr:serine/threonine phosphatase [Halomicronema hongdechloris]ASC72375.1 Protein serin-threonin phosphatase [Halomicronema hongdechloris C2206]